MSRDTQARARVALLFYSTINVVTFTAAVYAVTLFPPLTPDAGFWLAVFTGASLLLTAPVAWAIGRIVPEAWRRRIMPEPSPLARAPSRPV
jgi:hypothetical protein